MMPLGVMFWLKECARTRLFDNGDGRGDRCPMYFEYLIGGIEDVKIGGAAGEPRSFVSDVVVIADIVILPSTINDIPSLSG
jgi:hypothetical protein